MAGPWSRLPGGEVLAAEDGGLDGPGRLVRGGGREDAGPATGSGGPPPSSTASSCSSISSMEPDTFERQRLDDEIAALDGEAVAGLVLALEGGDHVVRRGKGTSIAVSVPA